VSRSHDYVTESVEETISVGHDLGKRLQGGEVLLLFGPMGAGKTHFVRGVCSGLGIDTDQVSSPSYALINEYSGPTRLYHVDLYRLATVDLPDLGLDELYGGRSIVAIEWAERLEEAAWDLGTSIIIEIDYHPSNDNARLIAIDEADRS
jgi:tRNA threonylcarbamoyladenosine biosynthesis protein TsaE